MLDIEMPIVALFYFLTHRLLRGVPVWQGKKSNDGFPAFWKVSRSVNGHSYAVFHSERIDTIVLLGNNQVTDEQKQDGR